MKRPSCSGKACSIELTELFIRLVEAQCKDLMLQSPGDPQRRGSQVCFSHPHAYAVMQALIQRGVIGDFRAPDILRFGFAPLYVSHTDVWDAAQRLHQVLATKAWQDTAFEVRAAVT